MCGIASLQFNTCVCLVRHLAILQTPRLLGGLARAVLLRHVRALLQEPRDHRRVARLRRLVQGVGAAEEALLGHVHAREALLLQPGHDLVLARRGLLRYKRPFRTRDMAC